MLRIFKGHDARQGYVVTHVQPGTRHFSGLGKAVKDAACLRGAISLAALTQNGQRVGRAAAGVNDQRLLRNLRRTDMGAKTLALPLQIGNRAAALAVFHAVVIKTGLTNRHHTG